MPARHSDLRGVAPGEGGAGDRTLRRRMDSDVLAVSPPPRRHRLDRRGSRRVEVAPFMAVVPIDDRDAARMLVKPLVAFYIGGMGKYYHALFHRYGFGENADLVRELYQAGDRARAGAAVSDELIDAIA